MQLVGINDSEERRAGIEENYFAADGRLLVLRRFGDWPIGQQLAGILVVPGSDQFVDGDPVLGGEITDLVARQPGHLQPAGGDGQHLDEWADE